MKEISYAIHEYHPISASYLNPCVQNKVTNTESWALGLHKQWFRAVAMVLGLYELFRPEGLLRLAWVSEIPEATFKKANMLRLQTTALRNGDTSWIAPLDLEFGLLHAGCKIPFSETVSVLPDTITLRYPSETKFDGWYMVTGKVRGVGIFYMLHSII